MLGRYTEGTRAVTVRDTHVPFSPYKQPLPFYKNKKKRNNISKRIRYFQIINVTTFRILLKLGRHRHERKQDHRSSVTDFELRARYEGLSQHALLWRKWTGTKRRQGRYRTTRTERRQGRHRTTRTTGT